MIKGIGSRLPTANCQLPTTNIWRLHGLILAGYTLLSVAITYPLVLYFGNGIVGGPIARADGWQNVWAGWWSLYALRHGLNPFFTPMLYYPVGISLLLQTLNITNWIMTLPVQIVAGPVAAYNAAVLLGFTLSAYTTYLLVQRVVQHRLAALLAGAFFTAAPFHVSKLYDGQLEHMALQWLPLYALALLLVTERPSWSRLGLWTLALALVSYTSWYYTIFCAAYTGVALLWLAWAERQWRRAGILALLFGALGLLVVTPALWTVLASGEDTRPAVHWIDQARESSADLTEFFLPSALHPLWGAPIEALQASYHPNNTGWLITPGYTVLALAVYGAVRAWSVARRWVVLLVAMALLALGGSLKVGGYDTGIPLPYRLFELVPGANLGRRPSHFAALALVPLAVLVGLGLRDCWERAGRKHVLLALILATLVAVEYTPRPKEVMALQVSPAYATLVGRTGGVFDVPANAGALADLSDTLKHQMVHQRPIIGGYVSRRPDYWLSSAPGMRQLWRLRCTADDASDPRDAVLGALAFYEVRDIVVDLTDLSADKGACAQRLLADWGLASQAGPDPQVVVYPVPPVPTAPFVYPFEGWYAPDSAKHVWRWMGHHGTLVVANPIGKPATVVVAAALQSYRIPRTVRVVIGDSEVARLTVESGPARIYRFSIESPAGEQLLSLYTDAEPDPAPNTERLISIALGDTEVQALRAPAP